MADPEGTIRVAEEVARILESRGVGAVVIGAVALAAHGYVRFTDDLDLGINTDQGTLRQVADGLRMAGFEVALREPDGADPLGGVIDVRGAFGLVQIVNFGGRFPAVIDESIAEADTVIRPGSLLRIMPLPHLVALKLYSGGMKSRADIVELLAFNPGADIARIRGLCEKWRLGGFDALIDESASGR